MKFCLVNYNTTELTTCALLSIRKNHPNANLLIFDNSDKQIFDNQNLFNNLTYIDNTKGQIINFDNELKKYPNRTIAQQKGSGANFGSAKHSITIQWLLDNLNEEIVLFDTDILLKKPLDFIDDTKVCISDSKPNSAGMTIRVLPFLAYMNIPLINKNKLKFFDGNRMHALTTGRGFFYDTGASFYEDIMITCPNLYHKINFNDYIIHFCAGSWKTFDKSLLVKYKEYWE